MQTYFLRLPCNLPTDIIFLTTDYQLCQGNVLVHMISDTWPLFLVDNFVFPELQWDQAADAPALFSDSLRRRRPLPQYPQLHPQDIPGIGPRSVLVGIPAGVVLLGVQSRVQDAQLDFCDIDAVDDAVIVDIAGIGHRRWRGGGGGGWRFGWA